MTRQVASNSRVVRSTRSVASLQKAFLAIILVVIVLVLMQRRRRYQPDARSPDYEVGGNKYIRDSKDKTRRT